MTQQCEFPGCENDASRTYCSDCRQRTRRTPRVAPVSFWDIIAMVLFIIVAGMVLGWLTVGVVSLL